MRGGLGARRRASADESGHALPELRHGFSRADRAARGAHRARCAAASAAAVFNGVAALVEEATRASARAVAAARPVRSAAPASAAAADGAAAASSWPKPAARRARGPVAAARRRSRRWSLVAQALLHFRAEIAAAHSRWRAGRCEEACRAARLRDVACRARPKLISIDSYEVQRRSAARGRDRAECGDPQPRAVRRRSIRRCELTLTDEGNRAVVTPRARCRASTSSARGAELIARGIEAGGEARAARVLRREPHSRHRLRACYLFYPS